MLLMSWLNKISKRIRWLRWSTVLAVLFYMFFIGLILHTTTYKIQQRTIKSQTEKNQQQQQEKPIQLSGHSDRNPWEPGRRLTNANEPSNNSNGVSTKNGKLLQRDDKLAQINAATEAAATIIDSNKSEMAALSSALASALVSLAASEGDTAMEKALDSASVSASSKGNKTIMTTSTKVAVNAKTNDKDAKVQSHSAPRRAPQTVLLVDASLNEKHILKKAFKRADRNQDNYLTIQELAQYINRNIIDHIDEAIRLNAKEFRRVDIDPADGVVTWDEYHRYFLKEHGMTEADIDEHNEIKHTALNRKAREDMMRDKARWSEAARTDLFTLTIDEYLSFRHPESSISNLLELVDDLLRQFDQDGDDQLSIEEFSEVNVADDDDLLRKSLISKTVVERKEEFKRIIDKNHDGQADRGELLYYVNPKTPRYALQEAATLFSLCDDDGNGKLTINELLANAEIFLTSKMIDTAHSFHTEF